MNETLIRELGDGLRLRRARPEEAEAVAAFNSLIHGGPRVAAYARDMLTDKRPTMCAGNFTIVEKVDTGEIISSLCLIPHTWAYDGIPFEVGQIELVGTLPEYRNRGLVRLQMDVAHQWSLEQGQAAQVIAGIPYYYRQFGYEMALNLSGHRAGYEVNLPKLGEGQAEPFVIRAATEADLSFVARLYEASCQRSRVTCVRDAARWRYELMGRSVENVERREMRVIETPEGEPVGFFVHLPWLDSGMLLATAYELAPGVSWRAVTPSVSRYLYSEGQQAAERDKEPGGMFGFVLGESHPVYEAFAGSLPVQKKPYAWYVRVPDLVGFLRTITPALERRLVASIVAGYSGELKIGFYRAGLRVEFQQGKITAVDPWKPELRQWGDATFPDLTFLQLLFGYRSFSDLRYAFADCFPAGEEAVVLVDALFPKQVSNVGHEL